jgi:ABC transporter with metal-binding/Fe-S-binding domain ATP-binding protein
MKVAALFSGGKDSIYAVYIAQQYGWEVTHLVTLIPENSSSWMFHSVNIHLTEHLSEALKIPLAKQHTWGEKETELMDLQNILEGLDIDGVISGAIASEYQRTRAEQICYELGIKSFTPLWHKDQMLMLQQQVRAGFQIMIVGVFAQGFNETWLGRIIDETALDELMRLHKRCQINIAGEGGEFETLVLDGPIFNKRLVLDDVEKQWKRDHGILTVKTAQLTEKQKD